MESKTSPTSSQKKLKQSRLPFQIISVTRKDEGIDGRKRRLSESNDDPARATKVGKIDETKENVKSDQPVETTVIVLDDNVDDDHAPVETPAVSIASELPKTKINKPDTAKTSKNCDKSEKIQKSVKKRKLKVVESESEPTDNAILKIKLPVSSKKRNKSVNIDKSSVGSAKTAEKLVSGLEGEKNIYSEVEVTEKDTKIADFMDLLPPCNKNEEDESIILIDEELPQNEDISENACVVAVPENPTQDTALSTSPNKHGKHENTVIKNAVETESKETSETVAVGKTTPSVCKTPGSAGKPKPETPKQLQRKKEQELRNLERQRTKEERERKIQEEKVQRLEKELQKKREREEKEEQRRKEREEREDQKRKEKKEREEKEEQKRLERDEKERKRLAEIEQKNEERKQKEEEKKKKEIEAELKKKRASEAFTKFFVAKKADQRNTFEDDSSSGDVNISEGQLAFMPFQKKENMRIAPSVRRFLSEKSKFELETAMSTATTNNDKLYIQLVRNGLVKTRKSERTWQNDDDDVVIVINEMEPPNSVESSFKSSKKIYRAKFLKFKENQRPAYYGTWRKKSQSISGRKPFAMDDKLFDYEVDSDDEWEEEEPGESLHGSDDEKDKESEDDYEVDNEFMVPHGHLSEDEEMVDEDERIEDHTPEAQKAKLKILQQEFAAEMKKKTEKIKPRLIGCVWVNLSNDDGSAQCPDSCAPVIWDLLHLRAMVFSGPVQFTTDKSEALSEEQTPVAKSVQKQNELNDAQTKDLIRLVHGSRLSRKFLANEFNAFCKQNNDNFEGFPKIQATIKKLATWQQCPEDGVMHHKLCWYVPLEMREKHNLKDLSLPNKWSFVLEPNLQKSKITKISNSEPNKDEGVTDKAVPQDVNKSVLEEPNKPGIKKFAKILTAEERQKQFKKDLSVAQSPKTCDNKNPVVANIDLTEDDEKAVNKTYVPLSPMVWFPSSKTTPKPSVNKKRVSLLMSVPRGQAIPETAKNSLISNFLKVGTSQTTNVQQSSNSSLTAGSMEIDNNNQT